MLFIGNFNLWIFLLIIRQTSAVSFNEPILYSNSSWNPNATTVANITTIGSSPYDLFINTNNKIYVPNQDNGRIIVWSEGNITSTTNISDNLVNSSSLFVTTTGDIYIDTFHSIGGVSQITLNATISIPRMDMCQQCWDLFININNVLYCSLSERHQIIAKSLNNDANLLTIVGGTGSAGSTSNMLNNPRGIFVDNTLNLYVADCGNDRIQLFPTGKLSATTIVGNGSLNTTITLNCPTSIVLDGYKYLYIVDSGNHRIVGSDAGGFRCIIGCSGSSGSASSELHNPWAISFDSYANIFVTDQGNNRIQKFSLMTGSCGNGSSNQTTLLLSDTNTATVQTLVNNLQAAGLSVNYISGGIATYTGSPDASAYGSVILITGNEETTDMPLSGQQSILNAQQNNGTGVVMTEWAAYHVLNGRWSTLSSLLLATLITDTTATMSYSLVETAHPIWNGLATSFSTSVTLSYSQLNTPKNGSVLIANCTTCGGPAVIVRPSLGRTGRIVQIAHAGHYTAGAFNWGNDANISTMMINAVKWAAQLI